MGVSPLLRPLGITAAILGLGQAVAWCVLSLLGILIHTEAWIPIFYGTTFPERLAMMIAELYAINVAGMNLEFDPRIVNNQVFFGFVCTYFALSFIWIVASLCLFWVLFRKKIRSYRTATLVWAILTGIISILDIVLTSLLIADYDYIYNMFFLTAFDVLVVATGVMMTIVARGFGFLLINIILFCVLGILASRITEQDVNKADRQQQFINAYQAGDNTTWLAGAGDPRAQPQGGQSNPAFDSSLEPQSPRNPNNAFNFVQPPPQNNGLQQQNFTYLQNPQQQQQQSFILPKLSKTPTGPYIPAPDYSPPTSPLERFPKSVLKNRSHYPQ